MALCQLLPRRLLRRVEGREHLVQAVVSSGHRRDRRRKLQQSRCNGVKSRFEILHRALGASKLVAVDNDGPFRVAFAVQLDEVVRLFLRPLGVRQVLLVFLLIILGNSQVDVVSVVVPAGDAVLFSRAECTRPALQLWAFGAGVKGRLGPFRCLARLHRSRYSAARSLHVVCRCCGSDVGLRWRVKV